MSRRRSEIFIIHFQPLELYPPACNLLDYLVKHQENKIIVATTENRKEKQLSAYSNPSERLLIRRTKGISPYSPFRLFQYLFFYLKCLSLLLRYQPKSILYFETLSSWPALTYKKMKGGAVKLLAHYHEYLNPKEYAHNMWLVKTLHRQEAKMYQHSYSWISQTNEVRLKKIILDNNLENIDGEMLHTMPNYPSKNWATSKTDFGSSGKIRLVYVGAVGYDSMYLKEVVDWVIKNRNYFTLDLYSYNIDGKAREFLCSIQDNSIRFHGTVNYKDLPLLLKDYDIGLVIYKPVSDNWIDNAPNKIFEYLACGLDVWFSKTMTYSLKLTKEKSFPKIIPVDFERLDEFDFRKVINRDGLSYKETNFFYETIYPEILEAISSK